MVKRLSVVEISGTIGEMDDEYKLKSIIEAKMVACSCSRYRG